MALAASKRSNEPIPGYVLRERIGAGGYGEVWSAEAPGGLVKAIKFVYGFHDEDRASRELKALNRIRGVRHPFLLSLERIEVIEGQLLIVTELADASLKDIFDAQLKKGEPGIPRAELLAYLHDTADALDFMNEVHTLQHLDVKPENLLIVGGRIKVADFGLVKDMHESQASMMGGLTPIYAPPEVFDARPSRRSDQYSLAIVFQEMLTGLLPFPGKTAAQLATQHLNARPLLSTLPPGDQPIIAKALCKDPAGRFNNCRELIDALSQVKPGSPAATSGANQSRPAGGQQYATQHGLGDLGHSQSLGMRQPSQMFDEADQALAVARQSDPFTAESPAALVDLPARAVDTLGWQLGPTLFIGLGGVGAKSLQYLRQRLTDQLGAVQSAVAGLLLVDTDSREIQQALSGEVGAPLQEPETLVIPLRKSQDYRSDSRRLLEWLGRRWLYNIPRSLQTEGMRPLGRLALVDHSQTLWERLRTALTDLRSRFDLEHPVGKGTKQPLRVVILAATSGGTGGGMVLDVAFALRQMLDELEPTGQIEALLGYGSSRSAAARELTAANNFALLSEMRQFLNPGGYFPGDSACGLQPREASQPALHEVNLIHFGEELTAEAFNQGCEQLAELAFLKRVTPVGQVLESTTALLAERMGSQRLNLHSLGVARFGFAQAGLVDESTARIAQALIGIWFGEPKAETPKRTLRASTMEPVASPQSGNHLEQLDSRIASQAVAWGLDAEAMTKLVWTHANEELGENPAQFFDQMRSHAGVTPATGLPPIEPWLAAAGKLFGPRPSDEISLSKDIAPLRASLLEAVRKLATPLGEAIANWLLAQSDEPTMRTYGAIRAAKWLDGYLKTLVEKVRETRKRSSDEQTAIERYLTSLLRIDPRAKGRTKSLGAEAEEVFQQYCQTRLLDLCAEVAGQVIRAVQSHVSTTADQLTDLARDIKFLGTELMKGVEPAHPPGRELTPVEQLQHVVATQIGSAVEEMACQLDKHFTRAVFGEAGGIRKVLAQGGSQRQMLVEAIQQSARQMVLAKLSRIEPFALLQGLDQQAEGSILQQLVRKAEPILQAVGGERALYCVLPAGAAEKVSRPDFAAALGGKEATLIGDRTSDIVLLYDVRLASLPKAAGLMIAGRADLAEAASRLHTRADIEWTAK